MRIFIGISVGQQGWDSLVLKQGNKTLTSADASHTRCDPGTQFSCLQTQVRTDTFQLLLLAHKMKLEWAGDRKLEGRPEKAMPWGLELYPRPRGSSSQDALRPTLYLYRPLSLAHYLQGLKAKESPWFREWLDCYHQVLGFALNKLSSFLFSHLLIARRWEYHRWPISTPLLLSFYKILSMRQNFKLLRVKARLPDTLPDP